MPSKLWRIGTGGCSLRLLQGEELKSYFKDPNKVPSWWRPEQGDFQFWHQQEFNILDRYFPVSGSSLMLDAACGQARFARYFAGKGCRVHALDINAKMLEIARARALEVGLADRIEFFEGDVETFANSGTSYDIVSCMDAMEHMADLDLAVRNLTSMLKKGGHFITTYTSKESVYGALRGLYTAYAYHLKREGVDIAQTYTFKRFKQALDRAGIKIEHTFGIGLLMAPQERIRLGPLNALLKNVSQAEIGLKGFHTDNWLSRHCAGVVVIGRRL
jgi:2-polyprenyl-3-methyl-5-hydroxy-6-metoxy-1,4-benzoquinol methylase